ICEKPLHLKLKSSPRKRRRNLVFLCHAPFLFKNFRLAGRFQGGGAHACFASPPPQSTVKTLRARHRHTSLKSVALLCEIVMHFTSGVHFTSETVREGFEPSVAFWATAL